MGRWILIPLLFFGGIACGRDDRPATELVGTIRPWALLLKKISGGRFTVGTFTPPGASPHTYSPGPGDLKKLERAKLVLANGLGLEEGLTRKLKTMGKRVLFAADIPGLPVQGLVGSHKHGKEQGANPHIWLDPEVLIRVAQVARDRLTALDPAGKRVFIKHTKMLIADIREADRRIRKERDGFASARVITFHDAFAYFRKRYRIELVAVVAESAGKRPSSKELIRIGERVKKHPVKAIFVEPQLNPKAARVLAREYGLQVAVLDPLGSTGSISTPAEHLLAIWEGMRPFFEKKK